jgi:hypothetical protein
LSTFSGINPKQAEGFKKGSVIHTPAFTSTSLDPEKASIFTSQEYSKTGNNRRHIIHFKLPEGYKGGKYIANNAHLSGEKEFLLKPNQKWKITGHKAHKFHEYGDDRFHVWTAEPHNEVNEMFSEIFHPPFAKNEFQNHTGTVDHNQKELLDIHGSHPDTNIHHDLEPHHVDAIKHYTDGSKDINLGLIHKDIDPTSENHNRIHHLSDAINKSEPLREPLSTFSGINHKQAEGLKIGAVVHTPAFTSSSIAPDAAKDFGGAKPSKPFRAAGEHLNERSHKFHFKLPAGYNRGRYVEPISDHGHEREFLLDKNQKWKVTGHEAFHNKRTNFDYNDTTRNTHVWTLEPHHEEEPSKINEVFAAQFPDKKGKMRTAVSDYGHVMTNHTALTTAEVHPESHHEDSIHLYTDDSAPVNNHLIRGKNASHDHETDYQVDCLKDHIKAQKPLSDGISTFSGVGSHIAKQLKVGAVIHTPAFTSSSLVHSLATNFAEPVKKRGPRDARGNERLHAIHFKLPKGYKGGAYVEPHSSNVGEHEYLLAPNQKWKITGHEHTVQRSGNLPVRHHHMWTAEPHHEE